MFGTENLNSNDMAIYFDKSLVDAGTVKENKCFNAKEAEACAII